MNLQQNRRIIWKIFIFSFLRFTAIFALALESQDINDKFLATLRSNMNSSANPCENFHEYSCGNWIKPNTDSSGRYYDIRALEPMYNQRLLMILENKESGLEGHKVFGKLLQFHESCKQMTNGIHWLDVVKPTDTDDWPAAGESWHPQGTWNVWATLGKLVGFGFKGLFFTLDFHLDTHDMKYHAEILPYLHGAYGLRMNEEEEQNPKIVAMTRRITEFAYHLGDYNIYEPPETRSPAIEMTIAELQQQVGTIDFEAFFAAFFGHNNYDNVTIAMRYIEHFRKVGEVVRATPTDVLIHTIKKMFPDGVITGPKKYFGIRCVQTMRDLVPLAMDYMYDQKVYSNDRQRTDALIANFFKAMQHKLAEKIAENRNEFSSDVVEHLKEKLLTMKLLIGNLPQGVDDDFYEKYYGNWEVAENDVYGNYLRAVRRNTVQVHELLRQQEFSPLLTYTGETKFAPFYRAQSNAIVIPYSYLQYPMVHPAAHELFVHAELAHTVGRLIIRALNNDVMLNEKFSQVVECVKHLVEQPGDPDDIDFTVNFSLNTTLAYIGGFNLAYETHFQQTAISQYTGESEFSNEQLYLIRYAQNFCNDHLGYTHGRILNGYYVLLENIMKQSAEFREAFSCPTIESTKSCILW